jgi:Tfp pilus assembly protein PilO
MSNNRQLLYLAIGLILVLAVGGGLLVVPDYRQASQCRVKISNLRQRMEGLSGQTEALQELADAVSEMHERLDSELKSVPATPDIADLMRRLSLPVDGETVRDQTFTAGSVGDAVIGKECEARIMPLTIDMVARFDSVFALIQAAESMPRLVRVASVRMEANRQNESAGDSFLIASVGLEAVYQPVAGEEGG